MKPIITNTDYNTIKNLIANCPQHLRSKELGQLNQELDKADIVSETSVDKDIIKINSLFEAEDVATCKKMKLKLTLPEEADIREKKISIFSPLGVALLGFRKGMTIQWTLPGGLKQIRILDVLN